MYAALSSQAQNDAEELLTEFVHRVTENPEAQQKENRRFARVMVLAALSLFAESAAIYLAKYPIHSSERMLALLAQTQSLVGGAVAAQQDDAMSKQERIS